MYPIVWMPMAVAQWLFHSTLSRRRKSISQEGNISFKVNFTPRRLQPDQISLSGARFLCAQMLVFSLVSCYLLTRNRRLIGRPATTSSAARQYKTIARAAVRIFLQRKNITENFDSCVLLTGEDDLLAMGELLSLLHKPLYEREFEIEAEIHTEKRPTELVGFIMFNRIRRTSTCLLWPWGILFYVFF